MKNRSSLRNLALIAGCVALVSMQAVEAISPRQKNDPAADKAAEDALPTSQEATEESVLPEEPTLSTPTPAANPESTGPGELSVQPLPTEGIIPPSGPTVDERRISTEAFRKAKTEAEEQPELLDIKQQAFAAKTEREKRALLRGYYQAVEKHIIKGQAAMKDLAQVWSYQQQNRLGRSRTEPDYVAPRLPDSLAALAALAAAKTNPTPGSDNGATATPTPPEKVDFLPALGN